MEKLRSAQIFEPEKFEFQGKYAFRRTVNESIVGGRLQQQHQQQTQQVIRKNHRLAGKRLSQSETDLSDTKGAKEEQLILPELNKKCRRSIKEFSYFDWSKVKFYQKEGFSLAEYNRETNDEDIKAPKDNDKQLPQVVTVRFI